MKCIEYRIHTNTRRVYYFPTKYFSGSSNWIFSRESCIGEGLVFSIKFFYKLGGAKNGQLLRFFLHCIEKLYPQYLFFMKNIILCLICDPKSSFSWMGLLLERVFYYPWSPLEGSSIRIFKEGSYNREGSSIGVYTVCLFKDGAWENDLPQDSQL